MAHRFYLLSIQGYLPTSVFQDFDNYYTGNFQQIVSITNQVAIRFSLFSFYSSTKQVHDTSLIIIHIISRPVGPIRSQYSASM